MELPKLMQYVVVRGDLAWPVGSLIAQGCHAAVAAIAKYHDDPFTKEYLKDLDKMTKVVVKAESEEQLMKFSETLTSKGIKYYLWREQPENIITALASAPNERDLLKPIFREFKLYK